MRIRATRFFISTVYGNVDRGAILTATDAHAKHLIENGLAEEIKSAGPIDDFKTPEVKPSVFPNPVAERPEPGSSLPAGPVSPPPTATPSVLGVKPKRQKKGTSR